MTSSQLLRELVTCCSTPSLGWPGATITGDPANLFFGEWLNRGVWSKNQTTILMHHQMIIWSMCFRILARTTFVNCLQTTRLPAVVEQRAAREWRKTALGYFLNPTCCGVFLVLVKRMTIRHCAGAKMDVSLRWPTSKFGASPLSSLSRMPKRARERCNLSMKILLTLHLRQVLGPISSEINTRNYG